MEGADVREPDPDAAPRKVADGEPLALRQHEHAPHAVGSESQEAVSDEQVGVRLRRRQPLDADVQRVAFEKGPPVAHPSPDADAWRRNPSPGGPRNAAGTIH